MVLNGYIYYLEILILEETTHSSMTDLGIKYDNLALFYKKALLTEIDKITSENASLNEWQHWKKRKRIPPNTSSQQFLIPSLFSSPSSIKAIPGKVKIGPCSITFDFASKSKRFSNAILLYSVFPASFLSIPPKLTF